ncbi:PilW family protein [Azospira restricta]|uniref:PilW family protein n=1 Tax=Azospira restricta TaxID=404405 RepID=A0A974SSU5_9RHOO|nr:PilW family protein [Azospira restricta]QRJ65784.1 PilW family protein [Azospira restricta]
MRRESKQRRTAAGFTLVELLVAMVIGLITVVVIGQVMAVAEERKRAITSGADTTLNGALALYTVERDVKSAGYGLTTVLSALGCEIRMKYGGGPTKTLTMSPISIIDGVDGAPDAIRTLASDKVGISLPTRVTVDHAAEAANFFVESDVGIQENDLMVAVPETPSATNWCSLFEVTKDGGGGGGGGGGQGQNQVLHSPGQSEWNHPGGQTIFPSSGYPTNSYLVNLGRFLDHTYDIAGSNLRLTRFDSATGAAPAQDLFSQIVQLQAVYGKDADGDCVVDTWEATQPTTIAQWQQLRALRIALVARSLVPEKDVVTLNEADLAAAGKCNTATPNPAVVCWRPNPGVATSGVAIKLDTTGADWQRYRYRVFESTIPVRNLVWLQKTGNPACAL